MILERGHHAYCRPILPPFTASQPPFAWAFSNKSLELQRELFEVCLSGFHARRQIYHTCPD